MARGDISAIDFTENFNISNESEFNRIDTVRSYRNEEGCFLPFAEYWENAMPHSFFISTRNGKHALVIIDHVNTTVSSDCNTITKEFTIMSGLRIDWYLQNDGTMDFSEITHVKNTKTPKLSANSQNFKIRFTNQLSAKTGEFYSINGKRIEKIKSRSPYGLVICKEPVMK